jgi:hypothetical protein
MDLLIIVVSATFLVALGLVADRVGRDLCGGGRGDGGAERSGIDDRPMRLELLAISPDEYAGIRRHRADRTARQVVRAAPAARPFGPTNREVAAG